MSSKLLQEIYNATLSFLQPLNLEERYKIAAKEGTKILNVENSSIFLEKNGKLIRVYSDVPTKKQVQPRKNGYTYAALVKGKLHVVSSAALKRVHPELYDKGVRSLILIPLSFNKQSIGVITFQSRRDEKITQAERNALNLFGSFLSLGIRNSQLYQQSTEAVEARDLFISLASHELKTPLTTISAYTDLIAKKLNSNTKPSPYSVEIVRTEIKRLKNMLNELLALNQIQTGQLSYELRDTNVLQVIKKALINFKFSYPGYKVFIENNTSRNDLHINGDDDKLQQVFTNILNNAAKFSSPLTPIVVSLTNEEQFINVSITDYGKGIKKKEQNRVFEEFFKESGHNREGMGLGLFLVKRIIEQHGGVVDLRSKLHKGTTVTIMLPKKHGN